MEITGPVERKMIINAFNSGADSYMTDFEDSNSPNWFNQIQGQVNLYDAIRRQLTFTNEAGKVYKLNDKIATLQIRPRGWHLDEKHVLVDGQRVSGGIFDFALVFFHNAKEQVARGAGPFFYLPKMESHLEARLWNEIFCMAQDHIGMPRGTIKATVLLETILATFEMEEILYELREHSAGLNAGRWDYIFSAIKKFKKNKDFCLANRATINMEVPFMRSYALALVQACHKRGAPAIGGMSALIPIKGDPEANEKAMAGIRHDKRRDANDGYDGGWVAHPGLVPIAMEEFVKVLGDKPNQWSKQVTDNYGPKDWLNFAPEQPITEAGVRNNINVGIHYLGSWLAGNGCVPIHNLMEDAATAEISRSQIWQWVVSPKGKLDDGRKVTAEMVRAMIPEELAKVKATVTRQRRKDRDLRPGRRHLREDGAGRGLPGVPHPAAVRSDGVISPPRRADVKSAPAVRRPGPGSALLDPLHQCRREFLGAGLATEVAGAHVVDIQGRVDGLAQLAGLVAQTDVIQHHGGCQHQGNRVGNALARDVRRGAMHSFEDGGMFADVGTRRHAETTHQSGDFVRKNVAEQVGRHQHVELPRVHDQFHGAGVDDDFIEDELVFVLGGVDLARRLEEDAGQRFHDVGFVDCRDFLASLRDDVVEGVAADAPATLARVDAGAHTDRMRIAVDRDEVLVAHVEAFVVLAHHHQVDVVETAAGNQGLGRPQVGVELELLAQAHVRRAVAATDRGFQRAFERQLRLADAIEAGLRQRVAARGNTGRARDLPVPDEGCCQRIKGHQGRFSDFRTDTIAGDQGCRNIFQVRHELSVSVRGLSAVTQASGNAVNREMHAVLHAFIRIASTMTPQQFDLQEV